MVQIVATGALPSYSPAEQQGTFVMSNGSIVAFYDVSGTPKYAVSTDSGATWTNNLAIPAGPSGPQTWPGLALGGSIIQKADVLTAFWVNATLTGIYLNSFTFNTGTNRLGNTGGTLSSGFGFPLNASGITFSQVLIGAVDDGHIVHVVFVANNLLWLLPVTSDSSNAGAPTPWASLNTLSYFLRNTPAVADVHVSIVPGSSPPTVLVSYTDTSNHQLTVIPCVYTGAGLSGASYNGATGSGNLIIPGTTAEVAYSFSGSDIGHTPLFDNSGKLDLIIRDGTNLYAVKRTGTGSYTAPIPLYSSINQSGSRGVATAYDPATGNAYVLFESTINQANGEIYAVKRTAGVWGSPTLLEGGSSAGYVRVLCGKAIATGFSPTILQNGSGVDYLALAGSGPPFTPVVGSPAGNITTLTPTMRAPYVNPSPSDPIGFQQWQVQRVSDSVSFLDTGKVATTVPFLLYAGTALVYGTQYQARVKYWDSLSAAGAGTPSGFSGWSTFTPVHGPVGTITSIVAGGATISSTPGTLTAPAMVVHFTYTQADGDNASAYRLKIYAADAVTLIQASPLVAGVIAPGGTVVTFSTTFSALLNSTVYYIAVETTDAVTGLVADGPQWQLTTSWTPPTTPGSFVVTAHPDLGTVVGTWTNSGDAVTNNVYAQLPGGAWILYKSGSLFTTFTARPGATIPVNYRVTALGVTGIESSPASASATMGLRGNAWGVWLTDITNPSLTVAVGAAASWPDLKWTAQKDRDVYLPLQGVYQKSSRGLEYWEQAQMKFWIPGDYVLTDGSLAPGAADVDVLRTMDHGINYIHYRDPGGRVKICELYAFDAGPDDPSTNFNVAFSLDEMASTVLAGGSDLGLLVT